VEADCRVADYRLVNQRNNGDFCKQLRTERYAPVQVAISREHVEGFAAFFERPEPNFRKQRYAVG
jgi:hypothetical protein